MKLFPSAVQRWIQGQCLASGKSNCFLCDAPACYISPDGSLH